MAADRPGSLSSLIPDQSVYTVPSFTLESGRTLTNVPVAYKTWGKLNERRDNVMVICHALTGSADVEDWWGPLMGPGRAFDYTRFFVFCGNVIGSPYGTVSPVSINPDNGRPYGPEFPGSTVRDDVRLHKHVLDHLGVSSIAVVIGGSMGGMTTLEWPLCFPPASPSDPHYVRHIIPIATSARHSAWCISWGEAQRQSIYSDPNYYDGYYFDEPDSAARAGPVQGLAAARMAALLTYRSRDSFESRFGRKPHLGKPGRKASDAGGATNGSTAAEGEDEAGLSSPAEHALLNHNDGHRAAKSYFPRSGPSTPTASSTASSLASLPAQPPPGTDLTLSMPSFSHASGSLPPRKVFSAQSYLRYQGDKFTSRFDANCYIHLTRKMDTHDIAAPSPPRTGELSDSLAALPPRALVIGIESDGLFAPPEQREIAAGVPDAELVIIPSPDGHDGFLLEFKAINGHVLGFLHRELPEVYEGEPLVKAEEVSDGFEAKKTSVFGEAEVADVTAW